MTTSVDTLMQCARESFGDNTISLDVCLIVTGFTAWEAPCADAEVDVLVRARGLPFRFGEMEC